ncbi:MAG: hypothetical protein HYT10_01520 [Candidatus Levybacteria bacterium]|nr:hypothetical protein [Candidatus Levybacteria bacterium]
MNALYIITIAAFYIWIVRNTLYWVYLWQLKEYRFDRLLAHLRETIQGRDLLFSYLSVIKWGIIIFYAYVVFNEALLLPYQVTVATVFLFQAVLVLKEASLRRLRRPVVTFKTLFLLFCTFFSIGLLFYVALIQQEYLWLLILDRLLPLIIGFFVFFLSFPTRLYQDFVIDSAMKKIKSKKNMLVIGVTGSYGKSSTKDYLAQILSKKFSVAKTPGTNNTPIGVASAILKEMKKDTQIFVAEMGAYRKGEIAELCQIIQPKIGILTAVSSQHLSLFGSLEKLMETKYELIESLPKDGLAFFNGNNKNAEKLYTITKKNKILYKVLSHADKIANRKEADIIATNVVVLKTEIFFDVYLKNKKLSLKAPLLGAQNIENLLPAIYIADYLGMSPAEIKKAVASVFPLPKTMMLHKTLNGAYIVDDTFNVNPDAVIAALRYAKIFKGKKIMVMEPMIELGPNAKKEHYRVGKEVAKVCDYLFLTKKNYYDAVISGILDEGGKCLVKVASPKEIAEYVSHHVGKGDIIIFEGKEAAIALNKIV